MRLDSKTIKNFARLSDFELRHYRVDPCHELEVLSYEMACLERFPNPEMDGQALSAKVKALDEKIQEFYQNRANWVAATEAAFMFKKYAGIQTCNGKTIRNYYRHGYIRGILDLKRRDRRIKICRKDVEDMIQKLMDEAFLNG